MFVSFFYLLMIFMVSFGFVSFRFVSALSCFVSVVSRFASFCFVSFRFVSCFAITLAKHQNDTGMREELTNGDNIFWTSSGRLVKLVRDQN